MDLRKRNIISRTQDNFKYTLFSSSSSSSPLVMVPTNSKDLTCKSNRFPLSRKLRRNHQENSSKIMRDSGDQFAVFCDSNTHQTKLLAATTTTTTKSTDSKKFGARHYHNSQLSPLINMNEHQDRPKTANINCNYERRRQAKTVIVSNRMIISKTARYFLATSGRLLLATALFALIASSCLRSSSVFQAQAIKLQPEGREKFYWSGEQFVITCQNNNNIKNVKIRWIGPNGLDITEDRSQRVHAESSGPHGHRLVVMNATAPNDDGQYKCTLGSTDDRNPREHIEFNLKLLKTTSFKETSRRLVLPAGQSGQLNCKVEFDPSVSSSSVSWVRDNKPIEMFNDSSYQIIDYDPNQQLSQLIISPVTRQHDGIYTCRAVAVTSQLSKISDHDIQLETIYGPSFDKDSDTVWVERYQSQLGRQQQHPLSTTQHHANHQQQQQQQQQQANTYASGRPSGHQHQRSRFGKITHAGSAIRNRPSEASESEMDGQSANGNSTSAQVVRVELRCTCQANPQASILWTSSHNPQFVLTQGILNHILEEPKIETDGANSTSTLVVGYSLDPEWTHRDDSYICSASNRLGKASKTFNIKQGDPPPAFGVGPNKQYNPQTNQFKFTLLGPNFGPEPTSPREIVPPVDSFRIRAENPAGSDQKSPSYWSRRHNEQSAQWSLAEYQQINSPGRTQSQLGAPQNFTIKLSSLPSGNQKLLLEAHNAVGWSPNATYLGEFYIVNAASSSARHVNLILNLLGCLLISSMAIRQARRFA